MENKIIEYLKNNIDTLKDLVCDCNSWNGSLEEFEYFENDDDFFENYFTSKIEVARAVCYGDYNFTDDYVKFNAYGNLESTNDFELEHELQDNAEEIFETWFDLYRTNKVDCYDNDFNVLVDEFLNKEDDKNDE